MRRLRTLLVAGVGALALTAGVLISLSGNETPKDTTSSGTTALPTTAAPVPTDPSRERWRWGGESIADVVAAGSGVVAVTTRGVFVGIDGRTGRALWKRRIVDDAADETLIMSVAPDRRTVVAWISHGLGGGAGLWAFDAFTGRPRWHADRVISTTYVAVSTSVVIASELDASTFQVALVGRALDTGREVWRAQRRDGCLITDPAPRNQAMATASDDTAFAQLRCPSPAGETTDVLAVDLASGAELWRRRISVDNRQPWVARPIGGSAVAVAGGDRYTVPYTRAVDQRTGQELGAPGPYLERIEAAAPDSVAVVSDDGVHQLGEPEPRWRFPVADLDHRPPAVLVGELVARFDYGCGAENGAGLVLHELDTGAQRRLLGCFSYPTRDDPGVVVAAPGALVVRDGDELIGYA